MREKFLVLPWKAVVTTLLMFMTEVAWEKASRAGIPQPAYSGYAAVNEMLLTKTTQAFLAPLVWNNTVVYVAL